MAVKCNVNGNWKEATALSCKVDGVWKEVSAAYYKKDGVWLEAYSAVERDAVIAWNCSSVNAIKLGSFTAFEGITSTEVGISSQGKFGSAMSIGSGLEYTGRKVKAINAARSFSFSEKFWTAACWYCRTRDGTKDSGSFFPIFGFLKNQGSSGRGPAYGLAFGTDRSGTLLAGANAGDSTAPSSFSTAGLGIDTPANVWRYLAMVRNGSSVLFFVDGVLKATLSARDVDSSLLQVGNVCDPGGTTYARIYWDSKFDDVLVTNTAKWTKDFMPPTRPLAGY